MSFSTDSTTSQRKRTATECAENNGNPLIAKKKACEAAKAHAPILSTATATQADASNQAPAAIDIEEGSDEEEESAEAELGQLYCHIHIIILC